MIVSDVAIRLLQTHNPLVASSSLAGPIFHWSCSISDFHQKAGVQSPAIWRMESSDAGISQFGKWTDAKDTTKDNHWSPETLSGLEAFSKTNFPCSLRSFPCAIVLSPGSSSGALFCFCCNQRIGFFVFWTI